MALADPILQQVRCVPFVSGSGIEVLGCPVDFPGSSVQFDATWNATLDKLSLGISHLDDLQDPQVSHALLRSCLDAGKVMHLLRSSDVTRPSLRTHIARADSMILFAFEECVGGSHSHISLMQASLPFRAGGCGIRVPSHFQVPARISFLAGLPTRAKPLKPPASWLSLDSRGQEMHTLLTSASTTLGENAPPVADWKRRPGTIPASNPQFFRQSWWSDRYTESAVRLLSATANGNDRDTVRLACQLKGQGSGWMQAAPSVVSAAVITPPDYQLGLRWWLGMPLLNDLPTAFPCPRCGAATCHPLGDHLVCCKHNNFTARHGAIQDCLLECLRSANQPVE